MDRTIQKDPAGGEAKLTLGNILRRVATMMDAIEKDPDAMERVIESHQPMLEVLKEARLQIEYLDAKFQSTGTSAVVLARIDAAIAKAEGRS